ncbi:hypothetical protein HN51_030831 [Arachis hypogaea]
MILSWIITLYTLWQTVEMYKIVPGEKRNDGYHELGQEAFGKKLGLWIVHETFCLSCKQIRTTYWIIVFVSVNLVLAQIPNFNSISAISVGAAVMSLSYSTIAWTASIKKEISKNINYIVKIKSRSDGVFNFFFALGDVAFAYAGHNVVLEIQATMPVFDMIETFLVTQIRFLRNEDQGCIFQRHQRQKRKTKMLASIAVKKATTTKPMLELVGLPTLYRVQAH